MRRNGARAVGLLLGAAADAVISDPRRGHPVALFGRAAQRLEDRLWADRRAEGTLFTGLAVGSVTLAAFGLESLSHRLTRGRNRAVIEVVLVAIATWTVLGGASLRAEASAVADQLERGQLPAAREQLTHLVGRDTSQLDPSQIARAAIESVAENTSDAVVAPLFWGAVAGVPGLLGYRAVNTLDAMVGHRSPRHQRFGWASARLDDLANLAPARLTALLTALLAPVVGARPGPVAQIALRYGNQHPSPNSGWCEAAFAGALGIQLGGANRYAGRTELRPRLGEGGDPQPADLGRANALSRAVGLSAALLAAAVARSVGAGARRTGPVRA
ncbi:MAG: cobD [Frankiales bacterium]|nr:cobD [Frankiales bacterium]